MRIIEIAALDNGAHRNHSYHGAIPPDWGETAFIREDVSALKNFPFGSFDVEHIDGVPYMKEGSWVAGVMPDPEPEADPEPTEADDTAAMLVDHEYRLTMLELGITE